MLRHDFANWLQKIKRKIIRQWLSRLSSLLLTIWQPQSTYVKHKSDLTNKMNSWLVKGENPFQNKQSNKLRNYYRRLTRSREVIKWGPSYQWPLFSLENTGRTRWALPIILSPDSSSHVRLTFTYLFLPFCVLKFINRLPRSTNPSVCCTNVLCTLRFSCPWTCN